MLTKEPGSRPHGHAPSASWLGPRFGRTLASAEGIWVTTTDGRRYLDCLAGEGALTLGHLHPEVVAAVQDALTAGLPWQTLDFFTEPRQAFVDELLATLPQPFRDDGRVLFCSPSGGDAIEAALKLCKVATGRRAILACRGAYHGMGHGALACTGWTAPKAQIPGLMPEVAFLPYPDPVRDPFGRGADSANLSAAYIQDLLEDDASGTPPAAAMLLEVVQGDAGHRPAPDGWLVRMRELTAEHGIPLVVDECLTGMGRTGTLWAFQQVGIVPDVLVLSKAIGGGLPLALIVYRGQLDRLGPEHHAGTFQGNQLAMVTGMAALRYTLCERLPANAAAMGERLMAGLRGLQADYPMVGAVRGRGLMVGVDVVDPAHPLGRHGRLGTCEGLAEQLEVACLDQGLLLNRGGRDDTVVRFMPPLIVTADDVDEVLRRFAAALDQVQPGGRRR